MERPSYQMGLEYIPPMDDGVSNETIVARSNGNHDQYVVGSKRAVKDILAGFDILDQMGRGYMRDLSALVLPAYDWQAVCHETVAPFNHGLLGRFGILDKVKGSMYEPHFSYVGVYCDVRNPVHVTDDFYKNDSCPSTASPVFPIIYASEFVHEWQHVLQCRADLPKYSLWSERHAMTQQALFLKEVLNSNQLVAKGDESYILMWLNWLASSNQQYRNGKCHVGHVEDQFQEGTPLKEQHLHEEDFV